MAVDPEDAQRLHASEQRSAGVRELAGNAATFFFGVLEDLEDKMPLHLRTTLSLAKRIEVATQLTTAYIDSLFASLAFRPPEEPK